MNPEIIGESAITMDIETGEVIYSKNADLVMAPASTTKLMTSLYYLQKIRTDQMLFLIRDTAAKVTETSF